MSNNDSGKSWAIITAAIITAIIGPVVVWLATNQQARSQEQSLQATLTVLQTQVSVKSEQSIQQTKSQPMARITDTPSFILLPTAASAPTATRVPTITPIPLPTSIPDTPSGTILEVGQRWRQGGLELKLINAYPYMGNSLNGVALDGFELRNNRPDSVILTDMTFKATDNRQRPLKFGFADCLGCNVASGFDLVDSAQSIIIASQKTINYGVYAQPFRKYFISVDVRDSALTEVIVIVSVSSIQNARWRISINR